MTEEFSFRDRGIHKWLAAVTVASVLFVIFLPPSFWLCGIGVVLIVIGQLANSWRTDQWFSWQNEGSLDWFEGWAASTGAVLTAVPLVSAILNSWLT